MEEGSREVRTRSISPLLGGAEEKEWKKDGKESVHDCLGLEASVVVCLTPWAMALLCSRHGRVPRVRTFSCCSMEGLNCFVMSVLGFSVWLFGEMTKAGGISILNSTTTPGPPNQSRFS